MLCAWLRMVRIPNILDTLQGECIFKGMENNARRTKSIGVKDLSEPDLTPRIKYIMVRLEN